MSIPTLAVEHLSTHFPTRHGLARAVDDVSFEVGRGEVLGLVGESGSGKSMTGYSLMGLVDPPGRVAGGRIVLTGRDGLRHDLRGLDAEGLRCLRGNRIAMVFQDPTMALNPVLRIETQMVESIRAHRRVGAAPARRLALEALERVGIAAPEDRLRAYPHQLSGGMRQRVAIAIALLHQPDLLIADEPTTALDVTIQGQILHQLQALCRDSGTAVIWISHDLSVVAGLADRIAVMYAGRIVESGPVARVLARPAHPYTRGLIDSAPSRNPRGAPLSQIAGTAPALVDLPGGCAFHPRCASASAACRAASPPAVVLGGGHALRCFHPLDLPGSLAA